MAKDKGKKDKTSLLCYIASSAKWSGLDYAA